MRMVMMLTEGLDVQGGAARESHAVNERAFLNIMILRQRAPQSTFNALLFAAAIPKTRHFLLAPAPGTVFAAKAREQEDLLILTTAIGGRHCP